MILKIVLQISMAMSVPMGTKPYSSLTQIEILDEQVRVRDIARSSAGEDAILFRLPRNLPIVHVDEAKRRELMRNRLPGVSYQLLHSGIISFIRPKKAFTARNAPCNVTLHEIPPGSYLTQSDVGRETCEAALPNERLLEFDRTVGAVRARVLIPRGTSVGPISLPEAKSIPGGSNLALTFTAGPVQIERDVRTLHASWPGKKVFVETSDGTILSAAIAEETRGSGE